MSNGDGVTATLSDAVETAKEKVVEVGGAVASTASATVAKAKKAAKSAEKKVKTEVAKAKKAVSKTVAVAKKKLEAASKDAKKEVAITFSRAGGFRAVIALFEGGKLVGSRELTTRGRDCGLLARSVELARQTGYRLGFTINPRGPVMFNWVPQADDKDDMRPSYIPEGPAGDPLLTLPRYWDTDALVHLDTVAAMGDAAAAYAGANKVVELEYYDIACAPAYGPIP